MERGLDGAGLPVGDATELIDDGADYGVRPNLEGSCVERGLDGAGLAVGDATDVGDT